MGRIESGRREASSVWRCVLLVAWLALAGCQDDGGGSGPGNGSAAPRAAEQLVDRAGYPAALTIRVTRQNREVAVRGVVAVGGMPVQAQDRFPLGSLTKTLTASLAGVLVQRGQVRWDSRLVDVLPELASISRPEYAPVTLRDLLAHRAAIFAATTVEDLAQLPPLSGSALQQRAQLAAWAVQQPAAYTPGSSTRYSNGGYIAAAAMLERAAGIPYERLLNELLMAPLGAAVEFGAPGSAGGARGHVAGAGRRWEAIAPTDPRALMPEFANPAGGALATGEDLARLLQLHLRALAGEQGLVLTPTIARELHTVVQGEFALGWVKGQDSAGAPLTWQNGSDDLSYYALTALSSSRDVAAAALTNGYDSGVEAAVSAAVDGLLK